MLCASSDGCQWIGSMGLWLRVRECEVSVLCWVWSALLLLQL